MTVVVVNSTFFRILDNYSGLNRLIFYHVDGDSKVDKAGIPSIDLELDRQVGQPPVTESTFIARYPKAIRVIVLDDAP